MTWWTWLWSDHTQQEDVVPASIMELAPADSSSFNSDDHDTYVCDVIDNPHHQSIVLDMDDCLLHTWSSEVNQTKYMKFFSDEKTMPLRKYIYQLSPEIYGMYRPGLFKFLSYCFKRFERVILWSAGSPDYVNHLSSLFFFKLRKMPHRVLTRTHCEVVKLPSDGYEIYSKPLKNIVGIDLKTCFFVDDIPENAIFNKNNHIQIPAFEVDFKYDEIVKAINNDKAFEKLIAFFNSDHVIDCADITKLDKSEIFT